MIRKSAFVIAALALTSTMAPLAASETVSEEVLVLDLRAENRKSVRASGEVRIMSEQTLHKNSNAYRVSYTFRNADDLERAQKLGFESIDMSTVDNLLFIDGRGDLIQDRSGKVSLFEAGEQARGTMCGDVVARGTQRLAKGLWVGVSLHRAGTAARGNLKFGEAELENEMAEDVFDDCDYFSWGGCGSGCVNVFRINGTTITEGGNCGVLEVWGPNTCFCYR